MYRRTLGEKFKEVRLQKKMTQSEVAGNFITRNMLSQIENGAANPSIRTIEYLAKTLRKPVSYFMDETEAYGSNAPGNLLDLTIARQLVSNGSFEEALEKINPEETEISSFENKEEIILLLYDALTGLAGLELDRGNSEAAVKILERAIGALGLSGFGHGMKSAELILQIQEIKFLNGNSESVESNDIIDRIKDLDLRFRLNEIRGLFIRGDAGAAMRMLEKTDTSCGTDETNGLLALLKAELLSSETDADQDEILALLEKAEYSLSDDGKNIFLRKLYKMKARVLSGKGDFKSAYHYLEKSERIS